MTLDHKNIREQMTQISRQRGNPLGLGTVESLLAPFEISNLTETIPPKHIKYLLGLDINVVVNS